MEVSIYIYIHGVGRERDEHMSLQLHLIHAWCKANSEQMIYSFYRCRQGEHMEIGSNIIYNIYETKNETLFMDTHHMEIKMLLV